MEEVNERSKRRGDDEGERSKKRQGRMTARLLMKKWKMEKEEQREGRKIGNEIK